jgi:hypothetical protein
MPSGIARHIKATSLEPKQHRRRTLFGSTNLIHSMNQSSTNASQDATAQNIPVRQIRARQPTPDTLIVYQAFSTEVAEAAVAQQRLDASSAFSVNRMTWLKPSFFCCESILRTISLYN